MVWRFQKSYRSNPNVIILPRIHRLGLNFVSIASKIVVKEITKFTVTEFYWLLAYEILPHFCHK